MEKLFFLLVTILIMFSLMAYKVIENLYKTKPYFAIIQLFMIGMAINLGVFMFIMMYYKNVDVSPGVKGEKGPVGSKGAMGYAENCEQCGPVAKNLGQHKSEYDKANTLIYRIPQVPANQPGRSV
jgi:hypothetical protein